jgi:flagellar biosynthesis protein
MVEKALPITNKMAISIEYEGTGAPKVTAKGKGYMAQEIIQAAKEHGVPIQENSPLVELLSQVALDQEIPQALYEAVAQVLIFAYQVSGKEITPPSEEPFT